MALFFDAAWFDAKLAERNQDRAALAAAAGLSREALHCIFTNERAPEATEIRAFAGLLNTDLVETSLRCGVASRAGSEPGGEGAPERRLDELDARLDAIDAWLAEIGAAKKPGAAKDFGSPALTRRRAS